MSKAGRVNLLEQQADQFASILKETIHDEVARQEILASFRALAKRASEAILAEDEADRKQGQKQGQK